jgi:hypothetical protein
MKQVLFMDSCADTLQILNNLQNNLNEKIKIQKGSNDSFDYNKYSHSIKKWNYLLQQILNEMEYWNEIFNEPQILSAETLKKIKDENLEIVKFKKNIISNYILNNFF